MIWFCRARPGAILSAPCLAAPCLAAPCRAAPCLAAPCLVALCLVALCLATLCLPACNSPQGSPTAPPDEVDVHNNSAAAPAQQPESTGGRSPVAREPSEPVRQRSSPATVAASEPPQLLTAEELAQGWIALFDGSTLFGWEPNSDANWRVEESAIVVDAGDVGLLSTNSQFGNYILKLEFRSAPGTNSGIFLQTPQQPQDPASDCYELNIADSDNPFPTGSLVKRFKAPGNFDSKDWQAYEITVNQDHITVDLAGQQVLDYTDPNSLGRGHIGLQLNQGKVEFRNIKLRPLIMASIFNGEDLAGWKDYPKMASVFSVTEAGNLNVRNGSGQLESENSYGDFIFQLECITHATDLNSGIFYRCIPGDVMMGYECQIHNGFINGDRRQPKDYGTGGIFRRQEARLVVADDQQWFHKTIIADGPHMAAWVNGYQVSDWTDNRQPDANPRRGLRVEPGTIMIQGHDPTTDLSFRHLRITEIAPRSAE